MVSTGYRNPRTHGFPWHTSGSTVSRDNNVSSLMHTVYAKSFYFATILSTIYPLSRACPQHRSAPPPPSPHTQPSATTPAIYIGPMSPTGPIHQPESPCAQKRHPRPLPAAAPPAPVPGTPSGSPASNNAKTNSTAGPAGRLMLRRAHHRPRPLPRALRPPDRPLRTPRRLRPHWRTRRQPQRLHLFFGKRKGGGKRNRCEIWPSSTVVFLCLLSFCQKESKCPAETTAPPGSPAPSEAAVPTTARNSSRAPTPTARPVPSSKPNTPPS